MTIFSDLWKKLSDKKYREHYALSLLKKSVSFQIKTLRKKHCGTQAVLAERSNLKQGVISRAEDQDYGNLTFNTVGRIAAGFDMAFIGRFVPFSDLAKFSRDLSEDEFAQIPTFQQDSAPRQTSSRRRFQHRALRRAGANRRSQRRRGNILTFASPTNELGGNVKRGPQRSLEASGNTASDDMARQAMRG
jgi:transcriptional regulator with XRE-family HTH domain